MRFVLPMMLMVACGSSGDEEPDDGHDHDHGTEDTSTLDFDNEAETEDAMYMVSITTNPNPIPLNSDFDVEVTITDQGGGTPVLEAFDAQMPNHGHGMNVVPTVIDAGDGTATAEGLKFHMEGWWELTATVNGSPAIFNVYCCE